MLLPDDVFVTIFSLCDSYERSLLTQTCQQFATIIVVMFNRIWPTWRAKTEQERNINMISVLRSGDYHVFARFSTQIQAVLRSGNFVHACAYKKVCMGGNMRMIVAIEPYLTTWGKSEVFGTICCHGPVEVAKYLINYWDGDYILITRLCAFGRFDIADMIVERALHMQDTNYRKYADIVENCRLNSHVKNEIYDHYIKKKKFTRACKRGEPIDESEPNYTIPTHIWCHIIKHGYQNTYEAIQGQNYSEACCILNRVDLVRDFITPSGSHTTLSQVSRARLLYVACEHGAIDCVKYLLTLVPSLNIVGITLNMIMFAICDGDHINLLHAVIDDKIFGDFMTMGNPDEYLDNCSDAGSCDRWGDLHQATNYHTCYEIARDAGSLECVKALAYIIGWDNINIQADFNIACSLGYGYLSLEYMKHGTCIVSDSVYGVKQLLRTVSL